MDSLAETLHLKLQEWEPDIVIQARQKIEEIIELADQNALDILRSRTTEQEVLDLLDEP